MFDWGAFLQSAGPGITAAGQSIGQAVADAPAARRKKEQDDLMLEISKMNLKKAEGEVATQEAGRARLDDLAQFQGTKRISDVNMLPTSKEQMGKARELGLPGMRSVGDVDAAMKAIESDIATEKELAAAERKAKTEEREFGLKEKEFGLKEKELGLKGRELDKKGEKPEYDYDKANLELKFAADYDAASKDYAKVSDSYRRIVASGKDPSAAGDLALIFNYMKILDPGSTVREGEFANAENSGGVSDRVRVQYNKALSGERLNDDMRKDFVNRAKKLYDSQADSQKMINEVYTKRAKAYGLDSENIVKPIPEFNEGESDLKSRARQAINDPEASEEEKAAARAILAR